MIALGVAYMALYEHILLLVNLSLRLIGILICSVSELEKFLL
jgi:hypothetical protein